MKEKDIVYIDNVAIGKVNSCEPILTRNLIETQITINKFKLKEAMDFDLKKYEQKCIEYVINHLVKTLKEYNATASEKELRVFAETFFELHFEKEYDVRTKEYTVTCTPQFKEVNILKEEGVGEDGWKTV